MIPVWLRSNPDSGFRGKGNKLGRSIRVDLKEEDVAVLSDGHGNTVRCVECQGHFLSAPAVENGRIPDPRTNFPLLRNLQLRTDDVFLLAYPKAGTHWMHEVIYMLRNGKTEYDKEKKETVMYEFQTTETLDKVPSPRTINSHLRFPLLPKAIEEQKHKIVFVQRNPKDVVVSYYPHTKSAVQYKGTFLQFVDMFMGKEIYHEPWAEYTLHWEEVFTTYPKHLVHHVYYEDVKENPVAEVKKLADFLDVPCSNGLAKEIADKCDFDKLKEANLSKTGKKDQHMFRKGVVGDWKNWFTVAKNEEFDAYLKQKMSGSSFKYRYEINKM